MSTGRQTPCSISASQGPRPTAGTRLGSGHTQFSLQPYPNEIISLMGILGASFRTRSLCDPSHEPPMAVAVGGKHLPAPHPRGRDRVTVQDSAHPDASCLLADRFAAKTVTSGSLVLITLEWREGAAAQLTVNSEKMVIGTMLVKDIIQALAQ